MFIESFIVLFLLRRSTSSTTQSVQSSTASSWTNRSDEEKLSPLTSHPLSCITHKIVTFSCAVFCYTPTLKYMSVTSHGHGFTYPATPPYMLVRCCGTIQYVRYCYRSQRHCFWSIRLFPSRYVRYVSVL